LLTARSCRKAQTRVIRGSETPGFSGFGLQARKTATVVGDEVVATLDIAVELL